MVVEYPSMRDSASDSKPVPKVALAALPGALRNEIQAALKEQPARTVYDHANAEDLSGLPAAMERFTPDVLLLDLRCLGKHDLATVIGELRQRAPQLNVVAVHPREEAQLILSAMRAGACEYLHSPVASMLGPALDRIARGRTPAAPVPEKRGKVVGCLSAKGGCGATTTACHVAVELKRQTGQNVLLADFDFRCGAVAFLMKAAAQYSILDALDNPDRLDADFWKALVAPTKSGVGVLCAPGGMSHPEPDFHEMLRILRLMRTQHDWIILDLGRGLGPLTLGLIDQLDHLMVVSTLDVAALHIAKSILRDLPSSYLKSENSHLVLNRVPKNSDISRDEIEKIFARRLYALIPDDYAAVSQAYVAGELLPRDGRLGKHFARIASLLAEIPAAPSKRFSLFG
jgi:pilus assembly protein CpaE